MEVVRDALPVHAVTFIDVGLAQELLELLLPFGAGVGLGLCVQSGLRRFLSGSQLIYQWGYVGSIQRRYSGWSSSGSFPMLLGGVNSPISGSYTAVVTVRWFNNLNQQIDSRTIQLNAPGEFGCVSGRYCQASYDGDFGWSLAFGAWQPVYS